jgi:hypothetical protein
LPALARLGLGLGLLWEVHDLTGLYRSRGGLDDDRPDARRGSARSHSAALAQEALADPVDRGVGGGVLGPARPGRPACWSTRRPSLLSRRAHLDHPRPALEIARNAPLLDDHVSTHLGPAARTEGFEPGARLPCCPRSERCRRSDLRCVLAGRDHWCPPRTSGSRRRTDPARTRVNVGRVPPVPGRGRLQRSGWAPRGTESPGWVVADGPSSVAALVWRDRDVHERSWPR